MILSPWISTSRKPNRGAIPSRGFTHLAAKAPYDTDNGWPLGKWSAQCLETVETDVDLDLVMFYGFYHHFTYFLEI